MLYAVLELGEDFQSSIISLKLGGLPQNYVIILRKI